MVNAAAAAAAATATAAAAAAAAAVHSNSNNSSRTCCSIHERTVEGRHAVPGAGGGVEPLAEVLIQKIDRAGHEVRGTDGGAGVSCAVVGGFEPHVDNAVGHVQQDFDVGGGREHGAVVCRLRDVACTGGS